MHAHIDEEENEKILSYVKIKLKKPLQDFLVTLKLGTIKTIRPQLIPMLFN